jgi:hypothetical protein
MVSEYLIFVSIILMVFCPTMGAPMAFVALVISLAMSVVPRIRRSTARYCRFNS